MDFNVKRMPWMEREKILNTKAMKEEILVKSNNEAGIYIHGEHTSIYISFRKGKREWVKHNQTCTIVLL